MSDSESFRSCSSEGSEDEERSWRPSSCNSQPGVGIQPFDTTILDEANHRRRVRREVPGQEGPVEDPTVLPEVPAIPQVSELKEQEESVQEPGESLPTPKEPAAAQEEAVKEVDPMAFKKVIPEAWKGKEHLVWTGPYSGFKERTWRLSDRDVACPVPDCPVITRHLREHALADHLSGMFGSKFSQQILQDREFQHFRGQMVILIARWLTGREDVTASEFVSWLQRRAGIPDGVRIQGVDMPPLRAVCSAMKWPQRRVYTIHPFNSPVVVLYWRVMLSLIRHLSQANRITIAMDEYTGNNEPAVAQSTTRVPATETSCSSSSVDVPPVTQPLQSVPQREEEERVTPPVEEPVAVATKPDESLVVLVYHNTRKLVGVTSVASAVAQAREVFDLEDQEVVLTYLGAELTSSVRMELLPAMAELTVTRK
ncbi:Hypothetical predicted protein [Mytilus galloprovincialis]|uniref:Uncharacterized protein n=1 Tax=Mytilus galloprovincialis TaxID=29158 RepID=A0A8B6DQU5_MYTGA|nr:Hypothetical predicted protein [Mytilus galloprovincialis]